MRLLAMLHALGINPALVAGLVLMPAVVVVGYLSDRAPDHEGLPASLRGSIDAADTLALPSDRGHALR